MKHLIYAKSLTNHGIQRAKGFISLDTNSYSLTLKLFYHGGRLIPIANEFHKELLILLSKYYFLREVGAHVGRNVGSTIAASNPIYCRYLSNGKVKTFKNKDLVKMRGK